MRLYVTATLPLAARRSVSLSPRPTRQRASERERERTGEPARQRASALGTEIMPCLCSPRYKAAAAAAWLYGDRSVACPYIPTPPLPPPLPPPPPTLLFIYTRGVITLASKLNEIPPAPSAPERQYCTRISSLSLLLSGRRRGERAEREREKKTRASGGRVC